MKTILSYKSDKKLKSMMVKEIELHQKQDALIQGTYSNENGVFKGCAVGCGVRSLNLKLGKHISYNDHASYASELGIPEWLARLEDSIFEGLPKSDSKKFPLEFLEAIPVGVDLEPIRFHFQKFLLKENFDRVKKIDLKPDLSIQVLKAIDQVMAVIDGAIKNGKIDESAAWSAESAAFIRYKNEIIRLLKSAK